MRWLVDEKRREDSEALGKAVGVEVPVTSQAKPTSHAKEDVEAVLKRVWETEVTDRNNWNK